MSIGCILSEKSKDLSFVVGWLKSKDYLEFKDGVILLNQSEDYAQNFGLQWNIFEHTQFDSHSKLPHTENRLKECSEWSLCDLKGKYVLEIGSGAGRFTEIFLKYGAKVVTVDLSDAVFANARNNNSPDAIFMRADFSDLQGLEGNFDYVFCYGVAQHTPDPYSVYRVCGAMAKRGGCISIDQYIKIPYPSPFYHPKYLWRPITTRLNPSLLLSIVRWYIPFYIKFDTFLIKLIGSRRVSGIVRGCIPVPCWNYYGASNVNQSKSNLTEWAIMDTFDALGAKFDYPVSVPTVNAWGKSLEVTSFNVKKGGNGVVFNAIK